VAAVAHLASHLAAFGETVRAGEVLITGSIVPALAVAPGDQLRYRLEPLGELALTFTA
jgi:2-keto-4-pentenoate hydratase